MDGHNNKQVRIKLQIPKAIFIGPIKLCIIIRKMVRYISCNPNTIREYIPKNVIIRVKKVPCIS